MRAQEEEEEGSIFTSKCSRHIKVLMCAQIAHLVRNWWENIQALLLCVGLNNRFMSVKRRNILAQSHLCARK